MFDVSLGGVLLQVEAGRVVLPAMQRPFVWKEDRITRLIDSMLRGFPLGTALLWKTSTLQRFRRFRKDVRPDEGITADFETDLSTERYMVLDGQQRMTSLFAAIAGTYDSKRLFIDLLSGQSDGKDPGDVYWDCRFLTENEAAVLNEWPGSVADNKTTPARAVFVKLGDLTRLQPVRAGLAAHARAKELGLDEKQTERIANTYLHCSLILANSKSLQVHLIDDDPGDSTPIEEVLEIFVRVNSGGLVLQKSDLLMSLLDLKWNDIQPELSRAVREINNARPFEITRDDLLKSLLLINGSETRFDRLVKDRAGVEGLAKDLPGLLPAAVTAWRELTVLLVDDCKIASERFFRGGHNSLLPMVRYLVANPAPTDAEKRRLVIGVYMALMTGVFASAETRMALFARDCGEDGPFPLERLAKLVGAQYGIRSLDGLLSRHLDLTLNIAHGGISLDNNPDSLQRDHIFPRARLKADYPPEMTNHYANFHFLRGKDNLNKSDTPPHEWFRAPGDRPSYTEQDLDQRLLSWDLLQPGQFKTMLETRKARIQERALRLFSTTAPDFDALFV